MHGRSAGVCVCSGHFALQSRESWEACCPQDKIFRYATRGNVCERTQPQWTLQLIGSGRHHTKWTCRRRSPLRVPCELLLVKTDRRPFGRADPTAVIGSELGACETQGVSPRERKIGTHTNSALLGLVVMTTDVGRV